MSTIEQSKKMVQIAVNALEDKKGEDIKVFDISTVSSLTDYIVIASGTNASQVRALVDNTEHDLEKEGFFVKHREGYGLTNWTLMDFGDIIIHVFDQESRMFYNLEKVWNGGAQVELESLK